VLRSIKSLDYPRRQFELVVVDNGSEDATTEVVRAEMKHSDIGWKTLCEPVAGICRARNTGFANAAGEWIAYLDDDALVPANWLAGYRKAILAYPEAAAFGGPSVIDPGITLPWWWSRWLDAFVSCQEFGSRLRPYPESAHPYGLNMVIRRSILEEYNGFDTALDQLTGSMADETDLFYRLVKDNRQLVYVPESQVVHSVSPDRFRLHLLMKRCIRVGEALACMDARYNTKNGRPLIRRLINIKNVPRAERSPALLLKECCEWYGYRRFSNAGHE